MDITGIGSIADLVNNVIDKIFPDKDEAEKAKLKLVELQQAGQLAELDAVLKVALKQGDINVEEAKNPSVFVSGWRPFIGWICGFSLGYNYIFMPFFAYCAVWISEKAPPMPVLETGELVTILVGMLGLVGARSFEKKFQVANK